MDGTSDTRPERPAEASAARPAEADAGPSDARPAPRVEPVQRWRLRVRRRAEAPALAQRDQQAAWEAALHASGLPIALGDASPGGIGRPRVTSGAPLTQGMRSEGELVELLLTRRCPVWAVREALTPHLPAGHELLDLEDVWLGEPPLPGRVIGADYEALVPAAVDRAALATALAEMLAADTLPRERPKGDRSVAYDLRPFIETLEVRAGESSGATGSVLRMRLRHDAEKGIGRPDEVLAELGDRVGMPFAAAEVWRTGLVLAPPKGVERAKPPAPRGPRRPR